MVQDNKKELRFLKSIFDLSLLFSSHFTMTNPDGFILFQGIIIPVLMRLTVMNDFVHDEEK